MRCLGADMSVYGSRLARKSVHKKCVFRLKHGDDPDELFDPKQLAIGIEVEKEHTDDASLAKQIAKAHIFEHPSYYKYLTKLEKQMKTNFVKRNIKQRMTPNLPWSLKIY